MSKLIGIQTTCVATVAALAMDGFKKYTRATFEKLQEGAHKNHGALNGHKSDDHGLWIKKDYLFEGRVYPLEGATNAWHPHGNHAKPVLPFPFSVFDFAAFILHGDGYFFSMLNFDDREDGGRGDGELCDQLDKDVLCEWRENGSHWANTVEEVALLKDAYALRAEARDRFSLRERQVPDPAFSEAAAWLLEKNNLSLSPDNSAVEDVMADEVPPTTVLTPLPLFPTEHLPTPMCAAVNTMKSLNTPELAAAFNGVNQLTESQWKKRLSDVSNHKWLEPARLTKGAKPKPSTWCPIELGKQIMKKSSCKAGLDAAFRNNENLLPWRDEWAEFTRERNAFGS